MNSCKENGKCLTHCVCDCEFYNEETDEYLKLCVCNYIYHNNYCSNCCIPLKCKNYKYCNEKLPKWTSFYNNDTCINCVDQMEKHTFTHKTEECCVCLENKIMIILKCNHKVCNNCWYNITKKEMYNNNQKPLCPLCRN